MVIKDLFTKLIKEPNSRKDIEAMISGKGKILQEEGFDEKGKAYEKYTPLTAQTEIDIKNFSKFNTSNMQKNIADSLYKYYKQKQKEIYKKYVKSIMSATEFYNKELDSMYGEGFSDTFVSLKEKEEAYIKMKSLVDSGSMQGSKEMSRINNIRNSAGYNANKKKAESIIKEIEALRQMKMRQQHHSTNVSKEDLDVNKLKDNITDLIEQNEMIIDQIQEVREENKTTISSLIDDSLADLEEMRTVIKESSKIKGKSELSEKILDKMEKLDKAKDMFNVDDILKGAEEVFSLLDTVSKKSEEAISENGSTLLQIKKKKETLDKMPLTRKKTRAKLEQSIKEDEEKFNTLPKAQQDSMRAQLEAYELIKKNADSLRNKLLHQDLSTQTITQQYNTGNGTSDVNIVRINQGSLINSVQSMREQDTESSVEDSAKRLEEMRNRVTDSQQSSEYEAQVNSMNNQMGKLEGTILKPGEYMEQMAREFGSYMLRVRMVQRGIQDIVGAIGEFQKIDDQAFQLGMVSDLNVGSIRRYRNEVLGLATDYRTTAEEILSAESEVIKSGRTFEQAKQQISASLILSRATFEDLNSASDTLNKLMLTLEISGNKSYETMSKLYNVVQNTPASLAGMEASMRQSSAAFSGLLDNIDFSGGQLEDYQGKLRDAELALVGFVNLQGKTPQMAGTAVKTLVDKMRSPTDKAKVQINSELARTGATYEGSQVTSDTISRLTESDFPQAIDLLSKLYINGNLTYQAIQDMFGPRNAATLSKLLYQVNGDLSKNSDAMLNKLDPIKDSEKLTKSWSEEMEELKNSFRALKGVANDFGDALLPAIAVTGDFVAKIAEFANGSGTLNQGVKSALQVGAAGYTVGKIGTNAMLATYSMNQSRMFNVAEGQEGAFIIGNLFKEIGKSADGTKLSLASLKTAIKSLNKGVIEVANGMIAFVTSGVGLALLAITAIMTTLYTMYKISQENLSKTNQNAIDAGKAFEAREQALQAENAILKSLTKTMESLNPTAFKTSESVSLLTQEIKNMLDTTIEYTEKLSAFTKTAWADKLIKEQEDTINNKDTSPDAIAIAEKKKAYLNKIKEGKVEEPDDKTIAKMKRESGLYGILSDSEHASRADLIKFGAISEKDASRFSDKELSRDFKYRLEEPSLARQFLPDKLAEQTGKNIAYIVRDHSTPLSSPIGITQEMRDIQNNSGVLNGNMKELSEQQKIQAEIWESYQKAKSDNIESINSAIAKDVKGIQDINNYINSLIVEKQKSIFNESGDYLSGKERLAFMSKDTDLRKVISETPGLLNKISDLTSKDAFEYVQKVALIKKQNDMINQSLSAYDDLTSSKKEKSSGKTILGNGKQISNMIGKIVDIKSKDNKSFEEATGITTQQLRGVLKDSSSKDVVMQRLKEMAMKNGKEIDTVMANSLNEYLTKQSNRIGKDILGVAVNFSAENAKESDVFDSNGNLINGLAGNIDALEEILIKTTDEVLAERITKYFVKIGHVNLKDILGARATYKMRDVIPVMTATNEMDRAMNALILASKNKLLTISAQLNNATIKMNNMGTRDYIENAEKEKRNRIEQWRQDLANEYMAVAASNPEPITKEEINMKAREAFEIIKNRHKDSPNMNQKSFLEEYLIGGVSKRDPKKWNQAEYAQWTIKNVEQLKKVNTEFVDKSEELKTEYRTSTDFMNKRVDKARNGAYSMASIVEPYVYNTGDININALQNRFGKNTSEYGKAIDAAKKLAEIKKASYDSLNISPTAVESSKKANIRAEQDKDIELKYANGLSGAQGSIVSAFKSLDQRKAGLGRDLADRYEYLQKNSYTEHLGDVTGVDTYEKAIGNIMKRKGISDTEKSKLKEYAETYFATIRESSKVQNEFIEQFRKLKNELITDTFNINQLTGKGKTSDSSTEVKAGVDKYYSNLIKISEAQLKINDAISKGVKVSFDDRGNAFVETESSIPTDIEASVSKDIENISKFAKENENILPKITAFVTDMNKSVSGEFDIEKLAREIASFDASAVISKTPKSEAEQQKNDKIYEQRIKAKNLYLQSYNDILAPLSSFPNIQEEISKNQVQILQNMKDELVNRGTVLKRNTDIVEISKLEVQILSANLEKQKQITQKRITALEEEKKYLSLRRENATMLGKVNDNSPIKNLEDSMKFAKEQLMISLEQIRIEEESKRAALAQIDSMGDLKTSIDILTETVLKNTPGYKAEDGLKLEPPQTIKSMESFLKDNKSKTTNTGEELMKESDELLNESLNFSNSITTSPTITEDVANEEKKSIVENYKQRIAFEEYINTVYKARVEYANQMDARYGKTIDNIQALIGGFGSGNFSSIKAEQQSLRKSIQDFNELRAFTKKGNTGEVVSTKMEGFFKNYTGDNTMLESLIGKKNVEDFVTKNEVNLKTLSNPKATSEEKANATEELKKSLESKTIENENKITSDKKVLTYANLIASTVAQISSVYDSILNSKLANQMEGLQAEEKVLNARKAGYRTELAKQQIDEQIYQNKLKQIETQQEIDQANAGSAAGGVFSGIGVGLMAINPIAGAIVQVASPFIAKAIGDVDTDSHMKAEQAKADLMTEKNYKEYNDFWNLFFSTIKNITAMASQNIDNLAKDYSSGRNLDRLNYGIQNQKDLNTSIIDSLNDFQGLGTLDEQYQTRTWYGKKKTKHITTGMNYSFDNLSLDSMKELAGMNTNDLKKLMIAELKKDNGAVSTGSASEKTLGGKIFGNTLSTTSFGAITGGFSNMLNLLGGSKFEGATWDVLDSDVTDFQESLKEAIDVIEYLSREIGSLADKIYYADKEGYASTSQEDVSAKYTELIANAKTAGNTSLAKTLQEKYDGEMQKFKDAGVSDIYYSTFSNILMEAAKKVGKETGNFADAYASGIGTAFGTQFGNIITEITDRLVPDNSAIDDYMLDFSEDLKSWDGNIKSFVHSNGVLDLEGISNAIGAESFFGTLTESAKSLSTMKSINMYNTSKNVSDQLRDKGLSENQIATFLESANLKDVLKSAVEKISDVFNPVGMSSAELIMQRESFDSTNSDRMEELRRKKLVGNMSTADTKELTSLESQDMKLSIKENVVAGFESGIKSALVKERYSDIFADFGGTIGDSIKNSIIANLDYSKETSAIADLISNGDIESASSKLTGLSVKIMKDSKSMKSTINKLRNNGMDWTEIEALGLSSNEYSAIEDILKGNEALKQSIAKYEKELYNYNNKMATDKYTSEEYYAELTKRIARNEELTTSEQEWYEEYETGLNKVIVKQNLLNSLAGNLNGILSNSSGLNFLKTVGTSIGESLNGIIVKSLKADEIMQSLVEKISSGQDTRREMSALSSLYSYAKYKQEAMRKSMVKSGSSYSFVESVFGENASSKVADVYMEMKRYTDLLGTITKEENSYKESLLSLNGITFTYEEYYRELALRKANNIKLTEQEVAWMNKYSESINEFQINSSIVTDFYSALTSSFGKTTNQEIFEEFANGFIETIRAKIVDGYLGGELSEDMASAISLAQEAASTGTVSDLYNAQQKLIQLSSQIQVAKQQSQGLIDMFDSTKLVDFTDKTKDIQYSASSSKDITYNITQNLTLSAGSVIGDGVSLEKLAKVLAPMLKPEIAKIK